MNEKLNLNERIESLRQNQVENDFQPIENQISVENEIEKLNFNYVLINPRAEIPSYDLGIEITDPKIAQNKENIDPQHGQNPDINTSAIEEALKFDLNSLKENAVLATIRPDADSVGAMAVIELRKNDITIDESLVSAIGKVDSYGFKKAIEDYPEIAPRKKEITAASQYSLGKNSIEEKVKFMKRLLANKSNWEEIEKINKDWETKLEEAGKKLTVEELVKDQAVIVKGDHPLAFNLGYEKAGIVTAYNSNFKRPWIENDKESEKWTIARYSEAEKIDIKSLKEQLNALEKQFDGSGSWGGPANLVASPQGETSKIPYDVIIETIKNNIKQ